MSIIAVEGLPLQMSLNQLVNMLAKTIKDYFEALNFVNSDCSPSKTCYLQLSSKLDAAAVVEKINNIPHGKKKNVLHAYVPDHVPNMPIAANRASLPLKLRKKYGVTKEVPPTKVLSVAHREIMMELQYKYPGLYRLSAAGSHALLEAIGMTLYERLEQLISDGQDTSSAFSLTSRYRKAHPHFGDFQLVLGALHRLQVAAGAPRTQPSEQELATPPQTLNVVDNVPYEKAQAAVSKYTDRIIKKMNEYMESYELEASPDDSAEDTARKNVRAQLAKLRPYLPAMMKQVAVNHFTEDGRKNRLLRMRMYCEPLLPSKEFTLPMLRRFSAKRISRWKSMYNLLVFEVPPECYSKIMSLDGTNLGGSNIILRASDAPIYRISLARMKGLAEAEEDDEEPMEE